MQPHVHFCLVLHNHQPVGNFDGVFEQAYQDSYLPFLDVFEPYEHLRISLHTSGPLAEWLDLKHPEYLDRVAALVAAGRIEIIGGPFYEPILTMIPSRDRIGQIRTYGKWLQDRLGAEVRGQWTPERVWEPSLVSDLAAAGIEYTILDDFHFKAAGLSEDDLVGYFLSEDDGETVRIFPGSEQLRYYIPFAEPQKTIDWLRWNAERTPGFVAVFGDDGEKFGTWPDTKAHVYERGWLRQFLDALTENRDWLHTVRLGEAADKTAPAGKIYLPDCSYREMTEWSLPVAKQIEYDRVTHEVHDDPRWSSLKRFVRGGFWRNFKVKYPETNEMYARMMQVSKRVDRLRREGASASAMESAARELYRGQCNCSYWHGAFGGIYLPHLRNAIFNHLIAADNLMDQATGRTEPFVDIASGDFDFDGRQEIMLSSNRVTAYLAPARGGLLYELDARTICHNLGATMTRRPESYHQKVLAGAHQGDEAVASIHDRVVFKQEGLDQRLQYDSTPRKSLVDRFFATDASHSAVRDNTTPDLGDFVLAPFEAKIRRNPDRVQAWMTRDGKVAGRDVRLHKAVTLEAGSSRLEIAYKLEGLAPDDSFCLAVEFNFAGLPSGADDRWFYSGQKLRQGRLDAQLDLADERTLGLVDEWLGIDVRLTANRSTGFWTFPIETVSQSEGGFELVHQSVCVLPHWIVRPDAQGTWTAALYLDVDTTLAESRMSETAAETIAT